MIRVAIIAHAGFVARVDDERDEAAEGRASALRGGDAH